MLRSRAQADLLFLVLQEVCKLREVALLQGVLHARWHRDNGCHAGAASKGLLSALPGTQTACLGTAPKALVGNFFWSALTQTH